MFCSADLKYWTNSKNLACVLSENTYKLCLYQETFLFIIYVSYSAYFYSFRADPSQTNGLYIFILRDIIAVREYLRVGGQAMPLPNLRDVVVTNYIMQLLLTHEIRQLHLLNVLRPILDRHAVQFFHELYNFASSPYDIREYDLNVTFTFRLYYRELTVK